MNRRIDRIVEAIDVSMLGFLSAVPLACLAFGMQRLGYHALPMIGFPLYCAWAVGRRTARLRWMHEHERRMAELESQIENAERAANEETKEP